MGNSWWRTFQYSSVSPYQYLLYSTLQHHQLLESQHLQMAMGKKQMPHAKDDDLENDPTWEYLDHMDLESIPEAMKGPVTTGLRFKLSSFAIMLMVNQVLTMVNRDDLMVSRQVI